MRTLEFTIRNQKLRKSSSSSFRNIIAGSKNYLKAHFTFDEGWVNLVPVAVFKTDTAEEYIKLKANECMIPNEVTDAPKFRIQVIGVNGNVKVLSSEVTVTQEKV